MKTKINIPPIVLLILLASLFLSTKNLAQTEWRSLEEITVIEEDKTLKHSWAGGLNSPQFAQADFNQDGLLDIYYFEPNLSHIGGKNFVLLRQEEGWEYSAIHAASLQAVNAWMVLADYNCDGIKDLFTGVLHPDGYIENNALHIFTGYYENASLKFQALKKLNNISLREAFKPLIADANADGYVDILSVDELDESIFFYENIGPSMYDNCDSLVVEAKSCWGYFKKEATSLEVTLDISCKTNLAETVSTNASSAHYVTALSFLDLNVDGIKDLALANSFSPAILALFNNDANDAYFFQTDTIFPAYTPIQMGGAPALYEIDIKADETPEILIAPLGFEASPTIENLLVYEWNTSNQSLEKSEEFFLVKDMIDVGEYSVPSFFDYNQDGTLDLVISNRKKTATGSSQAASLTLYEGNKGDNDTFSFQKITDDYGGFKSENLSLLYPAFGDLNGDAIPDLLLTAENVNNVRLYLGAIEEEEVIFTLAEEKVLDIDISLFKSLQLIDLNEDALLDLLIGMHRGTISLFLNTGSTASPAFELTNDFWGEINMQIPGSPGFASPQVFDYQDDGSFDLLVGSIKGSLKYYPNIDPLGEEAFVEEESALWSSFDASYRSTLAIEDINKDGFLDYAIGSYLGGLYLMTEKPLSTSNLDIEQAAIAKIFPNPANHIINIELSFYKKAHWKLQNLLGQTLLESRLLPGKNIQSIHVLTPGIYLSTIKVDNYQFSQKLMIY